MFKTKKDRLLDLFEISGHTLQEQADLMGITLEEWEWQLELDYDITTRGRDFAYILDIATYLVPMFQGCVACEKSFSKLTLDNSYNIFKGIQQIRVIKANLIRELDGLSLYKPYSKEIKHE